MVMVWSGIILIAMIIDFIAIISILIGIVLNLDTGECKCPAGFKGMDCEIPCERSR